MAQNKIKWKIKLPKILKEDYIGNSRIRSTSKWRKKNKERINENTKKRKKKIKKFFSFIEEKKIKEFGGRAIPLYRVQGSVSKQFMFFLKCFCEYLEKECKIPFIEFKEASDVIIFLLENDISISEKKKIKLFMRDYRFMRSR